MSIKVNCLNPIAACGLEMLGDNYEVTENFREAEAVLVRRAAMHEKVLTIFRWMNVLKKELLYLTHREPMQMV